MRLCPCVLLACVTVSHACDSKSSTQAPPPVEPTTSDASVRNSLDDVVRAVVVPTVDIDPLDPLTGLAIVATDSSYTVGGKPVDALAPSLEAAPESIVLVIEKHMTLARAFEIVRAAPPRTTRLVFAVRARKGTTGLTLRRLTDPGPLVLALTSTELRLSNPPQVIALAAPDRNIALAKLLAEAAARSKRLDIVADDAPTLQTFAEIAAIARTRFEDVRLMEAPQQEIPSMTVKVITGELAPTIKANQDSLTRCVKELLKHDRSMAGTAVTVHLLVDNQVVTDVDVYGERDVPVTLKECVRKTVRSWRPKLKAGGYDFALIMRVE